MDKILILGWTLLSPNTGKWGVTAECILAVFGQTFSVLTETDSPTPNIDWKPLIAAKCKAEALAQFPNDITDVDMVMFPDLSIVSV